MTEGMIWGIVGVVATLVVGIPIAALIARRYSGAVVLRRAVTFERLSVLTDRLGGGLSLAFQGRELSGVSRTYLALWHERGGSIRGSDVLVKDPLRVVVADDDEILQVRVLSRSNTLNEFGVVKRDGQQIIEFVYLDKKDGGVIEVLHTGKVPARIVGTIPGATLKKPRRAIFDVSPKHGTVQSQKWWRLGDRRTRRRTAALLGAVGSTLYVVGILVAFVFAAIQRPSLVDLSHYDLATINGQQKFALAVISTGSTDDAAIWLFGIAAAFMVGISVFFWLTFAKLGRALPKEILSRAVGVDSSSLDEAKGPLEAGSPAPESSSNGAYVRAVIAEVERLATAMRDGEASPPTDH